MQTSPTITTACALGGAFPWGSRRSPHLLYGPDLVLVDGLVVGIEGCEVLEGDGTIAGAAEHLRARPDIAAWVRDVEREEAAFQAGAR